MLDLDTFQRKLYEGYHVRFFFLRINPLDNDGFSIREVRAVDNFVATSKEGIPIESLRDEKALNKS